MGALHTDQGPMKRYVLAITAAGWAGTVAQILVLRESFVLFHGNELTLGMVLFFWLVWTAAGSALAGLWPRPVPRQERCRFSKSWIPVLLSSYAVTVPAVVLWIRGARALLAIPRGDVLGLGTTVVLAGAVTAVPCLLFGLLFGLTWLAVSEEARRAASGLWIYAGEAAGAGMGGLVFYFLLLPRFTALKGAILCGGGPAAAALGTVGRRSKAAGVGAVGAAWVILVLGWAAAPRLESLSRAWIWGDGVLLSVDTPYHNITVLDEGEQQSIMSDGLWAYSVPDPEGAERTVHLTLLQHPGPQKILVLGACGPEVLQEALRYPSTRRIDVVDPDPVLLSMSRLDREEPRLHFHCEDLRRYVRRGTFCFDAVLLNTADPLTLSLNRFRTVEFYSDIAGLLCPGGLFSLEVAGGEEVLGEAQARLAASVWNTLGRVFPDRILYPGSRLHVVAASQTGVLSSDPNRLMSRAERLGLSLRYVRRDRLENLLDPLRLAYFDQVLEEVSGIPNRDWNPVGFLDALRWWTARYEDARTLGWLARLGDPRFRKKLGAGAAVAALFLLALAVGGPRPSATQGLAAAVFSVGASLMLLQLVLFFAYQIVEGALYTAMALLVTAFMAGLSMGAVIGRAVGARGRAGNAQRMLWAVQAVLLAVALILAWIFDQGARAASLAADSPGLVLFGLMSTALGALGGAHFGLSCLVCETRLGGRDRGPRLYAWDLSGGALSAFGGTLILIPGWGLAGACLFCAALLALSLPALVRSLPLHHQPGP
ncbi:spermidine synthase [Desulfacinum hydrothermale DSM 13146]|uniref:Spermidine synthase n=1 Tax=Desulfacinum hydrothermale DSM 13146 TaxID=1121390 RepID=A0A1W1XPQ4_9BACT|nr:hypothetical protein [Desulfacinum hydrothermale]SMC25835.1 spermidine synthase [Desulfacinum hydrothermale DSM 13146]